MKRTKVTDVLSLAIVVTIIVAVVSYAVLNQVKASTEQIVPRVEISVLSEGHQSYGSTVELVVSVKGIKPPYTLQWQLNDGEAWKDIPEAHGITYEYSLSEENRNYSYRVLVSAQDGEQSSRRTGTAE